jgi:hypothetical protein
MKKRIKKDGTPDDFLFRAQIYFQPQGNEQALQKKFF